MTPTPNLAPLLCLASAQKLGPGEDNPVQGTHSDWLCRRCQWPWGLPSQSGSQRRTRGGRARGSPAPERSKRPPSGSGEGVGVRSRAGKGCNPGHPHPPPPKPMGAKGSILFQESSSQSQLLSLCRRPLRACQAIAGATQAVLEKRGRGPGWLSPAGWR